MRPYYGQKNDSPPDCWDPPATSSHARKCLTVGTHLVEAYVALSFWSRACTYIRSVSLQAAAMNRGRATKGTCRSRGTHVACTRTYSDQCARTKIRPRTYIRAGSRTPTRAYVRPGLVYMAGSERRNNVVISRKKTECVVFIVCSWGGNRMRRVHREATERVGANRLGRNSRWKRGLAYRTTEETAFYSTGHV